MVAIPAMVLACTSHFFLLVSLLLAHMDGQCSVFLAGLAGESFLCWVISLFVIAGLDKRGQETARKGE
jgi:hypothetical protein